MFYSIVADNKFSQKMSAENVYMREPLSVSVSYIQSLFWSVKFSLSVSVSIFLYISFIDYQEVG